MKFKFMRIISVALATAMIFCAVGCEFNTYVKTDKTPEDSVKGFFECIIESDFKGSNKYLANDASFELINQTGYEVADTIIEARLSKLSYEFVSQPTVSSSDAGCTVKVTAPDMYGIKNAMATEYSKQRNRYVKDNKLSEFPADDKEIVNKVATSAFNAVAEQAELISTEVDIKLCFQDGMWKIIVTDELCTAILGEVSSDEE